MSHLADARHPEYPPDMAEAGKLAPDRSKGVHTGRPACIGISGVKYAQQVLPGASLRQIAVVHPVDVFPDDTALRVQPSVKAHFQLADRAQSVVENRQPVTAVIVHGLALRILHGVYAGHSCADRGTGVEGLQGRQTETAPPMTGSAVISREPCPFFRVGPIRKRAGSCCPVPRGS